MVSVTQRITAKRKIERSRCPASESPWISMKKGRRNAMTAMAIEMVLPVNGDLDWLITTEGR